MAASVLGQSARRGCYNKIVTNEYLVGISTGSKNYYSTSRRILTCEKSSLLTPTSRSTRSIYNHQHPHHRQFSTTRTTRLASPTTPPSPEAEYAFNPPHARPLDGITIVALEQVISMPLATRHLSDLGARVIKIERPGIGDFVRHHDKRVRDTLCSHFVWINRNKESLALDIKNPDDMSLLHKVVSSKADIFVQNLRPGDAAKMGLGYSDMKKFMNEAYPGESRGDKLIYASISGYGNNQGGPYTQKKAYDLLIQAEAGLLEITGTEEQMAKVGCSIADISAGMYAYSCIMAAVLQRQKTGKGCEIDVSMLESLVEWMGFPLYYAYEGQSRVKRAGASHASIYPYGPFATGDGKGHPNGGKVMLGVQNEREWKILATDVLKRPDLVENPKFKDTASRAQNRDELEKVIVEVFSAFSADQVTDMLEKAGIANSKVNDMSDVWSHPQLLARDRFREVDTEVGKIKTFLPPGFSSSVEARMERVPTIGEDNDRIMKELEREK